MAVAIVEESIKIATAQGTPLCDSQHSRPMSYSCRQPDAFIRKCPDAGGAWVSQQQQFGRVGRRRRGMPKMIDCRIQLSQQLLVTWKGNVC